MVLPLYTYNVQFQHISVTFRSFKWQDWCRWKVGLEQLKCTFQGCTVFSIRRLGSVWITILVSSLKWFSRPINPRHFHNYWRRWQQNVVQISRASITLRLVSDNLWLFIWRYCQVKLSFCTVYMECKIWDVLNCNIKIVNIKPVKSQVKYFKP